MRLGANEISPNKPQASRLVLGLAALTFVVVAGIAGVVNARPEGKPTKEQCENAGFKNYGQCVSEWARGHGYGYAGENE